MRIIVAAAALALAFPAPAFAYIGPGAGLSLLGALWGLIAAVGVALAFVLAWPVRKMLRKRRERKGVDGAAAERDAETAQPAGPAGRES